MQRKHCICDQCCSVIGNDDDDDDDDDSNNNHDSNNGGGVLKRIFLIVHHKEIGLKVDTAKLILAAFPFQCELVVGGIGPEFQTSMKELLQSIEGNTNNNNNNKRRRTSLLLFPDETAKTLKEIVNEKRLGFSTSTSTSTSSQSPNQQQQQQQQQGDADEYDLIVLDGTWAQARKFHSRYFPSVTTNADGRDETSSSLQRVQLSEESVELLQEGSTKTGHQLRRHEIPWRQVGTFEAFRLFLRDWSQEFPSDNNNNKNNKKEGALELWEQIEAYQRIANDAALKELGPPRRS